MSDFHCDTEEFINISEIKSDNLEKKQLTEYLKTRAVWGCGGTKTDCEDLSEGCRLCGAGLWSCLFINNVCDAGCFYCPDSQNEKCLPVSSGITFESTGEYIKYLRKFGFRGCSISGGEPMMTPTLTLTYIKAVKNAFRDKMYVWMYTNGRQINDENLEALRDAGLDEIRFDIAADGYRTDKVFSACGVIPVVTVEIPAIPEDEDRVKALLPLMAKAGVKHLNLHQIMLTEHNGERLLRRGYRFTRNDPPLLPDSELTALRLIKHAKDSGINLHINYCSGTYQKWFQGAGYRRMYGRFVIKDYETFTDNGYIKTLEMTGDESAVKGLSEKLKADGVDEKLWHADGGRLLYHPQITDAVKNSGLKSAVSYSFGIVRPGVTYRNPFVEIRLTKHKTVAVERVTAAHDMDTASEDIEKYEKTTNGLPEYS